MARPVITLSRWEKVFSGTPWATNSLVRIRKNVELDPSRVLRRLLINVQGTDTLSVAAATSVLPENVGAIIEQIRGFGSHSKRGSTDNFLQIRGADLKEFNNEMAGVSLYDASPALATADAAYALNFWVMIDFAPPRMRVEEQVGYLLDVPNYSQLEFDIQFADEKNLWVVGGSTSTWSAQTVTVLAQYAQEKGKFEGFGFGLRYLLFQENASAQLTTTANQQNLYPLDTKGRLRGLLLKTGTKAAGTTAGNNAFATLSDTILSNLRIVQVPSQKFREYGTFGDVKFIGSSVYKYVPSKGYAFLDFAPDGLGFEFLNPTKIKTGAAGDPNLQLQADVTGAASQALLVVQDSVYYADRIVIPTR